jgi:hypothetical protein
MAVSRIMAELACSDDVLLQPSKLGDEIAYVVQTVIDVETKTGVRLNIRVREDCVRLFRTLPKHGVFTLKRAVPWLAEHLGVSRATMYSYLNELNDTARRAEARFRWLLALESRSATVGCRPPTGTLPCSWLLATVFQLSIRTAHSLKSAAYCPTDLTGSIIFGVPPAAPTVFSEARIPVTCRCRCRPSMSW